MFVYTSFVTTHDMHSQICGEGGGGNMLRILGLGGPVFLADKGGGTTQTTYGHSYYLPLP